MKKNLLILALLASASSFASPANAAEKLFLSGVEIGGEGNHFAYVGAVTPIFGGALGNGFVARVWFEGLTYGYEQGTTDIDAKAWGSELAVGYQKSGQQGWWGVYAGPMYRDTHLDPEDPSSDTEGGHLGLRLMAEGERKFTDHFKLGLSGSFTVGTDAYWSRARALYSPCGKIFFGPEFVFQGDSEYNAYQVGAVITGFSPLPNSDVGFKVGGRKNDDESMNPYAGVEFAVVF